MLRLFFWVSQKMSFGDNHFHFSVVHPLTNPLFCRIMAVDNFYLIVAIKIIFKEIG